MGARRLSPGPQVDLVCEKAVRFAVDRSRRIGLRRLDKARRLCRRWIRQDRVTGGRIRDDRAAYASANGSQMTFE